VAVSDALRERVRSAARDRCGYCRVPQKQVYGWLEVEHIVPKAVGGTDDEDNLWLACDFCNTYKGSKVKARDPVSGTLVSLYNPRRQNWNRHFCWEGPYLIGQTRVGRATVDALSLNARLALSTRRQWMSVGWHPPTDEI